MRTSLMLLSIITLLTGCTAVATPSSSVSWDNMNYSNGYMRGVSSRINLSTGMK